MDKNCHVNVPNSLLLSSKNDSKINFSGLQGLKKSESQLLLGRFSSIAAKFGSTNKL
jgi:hypothetical protein